MKTINKKGLYKGYEDVWYHEFGIANILTLARLQQKYRVEYDSNKGPGFIVHSETNKMVFKQSEGGLFYIDANEKHGVLLVETVRENSKGYLFRQIAAAK